MCVNVIASTFFFYCYDLEISSCNMELCCERLVCMAYPLIQHDCLRESESFMSFDQKSQ